MPLLKNLQSQIRPVAAQPEETGLELSPTLLTDMVNVQDNTIDEVRDRHRSDYIHVSGLMDLCVRRHILCVRDNINPLWQPRGPDRVVWTMGRAAEHHVRQSIIRSLNFSNVIGVWSCPCGELEYGGLFVSSRQCSRCRHSATVYGEYPLFDDDAMVVGHPDLLLLIGNRVLVVEIKSMNKKDYLALSQPVANHIFQGMSYHKLLTLLGRDMLGTVAFVYVCKDYDYRTSPYKEIHLSSTESPWPRILDNAWDKAYEVKAARDVKRLPPRLDQCPNPNTTTARNCIACVNCFSRNT